MSDFNFYLNRQGVRGRKGDKGEQGFSPVITEYDTGNPLEYVLRIQTEDGVMYTRNLLPEFTNNGGTYLRFNQSNNTYRIDAADYATTSSQGEVRLANASDITNLTSTTTAVTPKDVDTILTNKGYANSISNLQSNVSDLDGDLTSLYGTVTNLSGTVSSLSNTVTSNYNNTVKLSDNQTISGNKTFTNAIRTNTISTQDGQKTMIDYNSSSNSMRIGGASTSNVYLRTSSSGKLIHTKEGGTEYEVYDTSNLTNGRGINITNGEVAISDEIPMNPITGVALLSDGILRVKTGGYQIAVPDGRYRNVAKKDTDYNTDGIVFGDLHCITNIRTSGNAVNIIRLDSDSNGQIYTNIDSGNISNYTPTITNGTGISVSTSGSTITISVDNTVVQTSGYQTIYGEKVFEDSVHLNNNVYVQNLFTENSSTGIAESWLYSNGNTSTTHLVRLGYNSSSGVRIELRDQYNDIRIRRNNAYYTNIDSGNISNYAGNVSSSSINNIVKLTQADYDALVQGGTVDASTLYIIV